MKKSRCLSLLLAAARVFAAVIAVVPTAYAKAGGMKIIDLQMESCAVDVRTSEATVPMLLMLEAASDAQGITVVEVELQGTGENKVQYQHSFDEPFTGDFLELDVVIPQNAVKDTYTLNAVRLICWEDGEDPFHTVWWRPEDDFYSADEGDVVCHGKVEVVVESDNTDMESPVLRSVTFEKEEYMSNDDYVTVLFDAEDDSQIVMAEAGFIVPGSIEEHRFYSTDVIYYDDALDKWVAGFEPFFFVSDFELPTELTIDEFCLTDASGIRCSYMDEDRDGILTCEGRDSVSAAECRTTFKMATVSAGNRAFVTDFTLNTHQIDLASDDTVGNITIHVDQGNSSGIKTVHVAFAPVNYEEGKCNAIHVIKNFDEAQLGDVIEFDFTVPADTPNDLYHVQMISVGDFEATPDGGHGFPTEDSWNTDSGGGYDPGKGTYVYKVESDGAVIEGSMFENDDPMLEIVGSSNNDTMAPRINAAWIEQKEYVLPAEMTVSFDITEDSDIRAAQIMIYNGIKYISLYTEDNILRVDDTTLEVTFLLDDTQIPAGDYETVKLELWDEWGYNCVYEVIPEEDAWKGEPTAPGELAGVINASTEWRLDVTECSVTIFNEREIDQVAPQITNVTIRDNTIKSPELVYLDVDFIEENDLSHVGAVWVCQANSEWIEYGLPSDMLEALVSGEGEEKTVTIILPVSQYRPEGAYTLHRIDLCDDAGNLAGIYADDGMVDYGFEHTCRPDLTERGNFTVSNSTAFYEKLVSVRDDIAEQIEQSPNDANILITVPNVDHADENVKEEWLRAIMGTERTLTVVNKNGVQWIWKGEDIKNNGDVKDIDIHVEIELVDGDPWGYENYVQKVVFGNNGRLPGDPRVRIPVEFYFWKAGLNQVFFDMIYVDGDELEEVEDDIPIAGDAFVEVTMKHNSTYLLVPADTDAVVDPPVQDDPPKTGDSMIWIVMGMTAAAAAACGMTAYNRRKVFFK